MCEIMVVDGDSDASNVFKAAKMMYEKMGDGLGIVAVYRDEDAGEFDYNIYKSETPAKRKAKTFLHNHDPWKFVVHARLATAGGTGYEETHPISIIEDDVDINFVVHNGHVQEFGVRDDIEEKGYELNTDVDSELLAHAHEDLPASMDEFDEPTVAGRLNYLLFTDERILIRNDGKYQIDDSMQMTCRSKWAPDRAESEEGFRLYKPDGSYETAPIEESGTSAWGSGGWKSKYSSGNRYSGGYRVGSHQENVSYDDERRKQPLGSPDDEEEEEESTDVRPDAPADEYETTGDDRVDDLQVREYFTNNPPHYWQHMGGDFVCTIHNNEFGTDQCCQECVEMIDPDDLKYFEQGEQRKARQRDVSGY